jgi:acetolactate synthase I/II/III large subunit
MSIEIRGADIVVRSLERAGCANVFTLSGNHIMPLFDAVLGSKLRLLHARHEAAAVHMADAWGRLTGQCGIALVSGWARWQRRQRQTLPWSCCRVMRD